MVSMKDFKKININSGRPPELKLSRDTGGLVTSDGEIMKRAYVVIVAGMQKREYWSAEKSIICASNNAKHADPMYIAPPGGTRICAECAYAKPWSSVDKNGNPTSAAACKLQFVAACLLFPTRPKSAKIEDCYKDDEGNPKIYRLALPPSSLENASRYVNSLPALETVLQLAVTEIQANTKTNSHGSYAVAEFCYICNVEEDDWGKVHAIVAPASNMLSVVMPDYLHEVKDA